MNRWSIAMLLVLTAACGEQSSTDGTGGSDSSTTGIGGQGGASVDPNAALYACEELQFNEVKPLSGPGFELGVGLTGAPQANYVLHATQIYLQPGKEAAFFGVAGKVVGQLGTTPGLVAFALASDDGCGVARTMGVWESEEALYAFVGSGAHAGAMAQTSELSITGRTTHWDATADQANALTWDVARAQLADVASISGYY